MRRAAAFVVTGVLATGLGVGGAPHPHGSVTACTAAAVRAIEHQVPLTTVTTACQGLSRADVNFALGRAIYDVAGAHQHKRAWRRRAAVAGARLARLIQSQRRSPPPAAEPSPRAPAAPASRWGLGLATLAAWLLTVGIGISMLAGWIRHGGLRPRGRRNRLSPAVTVGHFSVASSGLVVWIAYLATGSIGLAWAAVGVLLAAIGLGMATLTVWSSRAVPAAPQPSSGPVSEPPAPPHRPQDDLRIILPVAHGLAASATILLALLTALTVH